MDIRDELTTYYQWLRQYGYNDSHSGNISARNHDHFWITPTGACADTLKADDFIAVPLHGDIPTEASGDANLHQKIYQQTPVTAAIIHSHCPYATALTMDSKAFIPPDFEGQLYFPVVPVITVPYISYFEEAAPRVAEALTGHTVCIVQGHGVYAHGETLNQAYKWNCSLELSAKTAFIARQAGNT